MGVFTRHYQEKVDSIVTECYVYAPSDLLGGFLNHSVMKINYIKYHNYRCFKDVTVRFDTTDQKNISLVLGANGSGKTEMLFSFQWNDAVSYFVYSRNQT